MSAHIAGFAPATRVASRKLLPTAGRSSPADARGGLPTSTFASTCGRWLIAAIRRSCSAASMACGRAPMPAISPCRRSKSVPCERGLGVRYQRAPSKRSSRDPSTPAVSAPASGWPPTKRSAPGLDRLEQGTFRRADVGDDGAGPGRLQRRANELRQDADGGAEAAAAPATPRRSSAARPPRRSRRARAPSQRRGLRSKPATSAPRRRPRRGRSSRRSARRRGRRPSRVPPRGAASAHGGGEPSSTALVSQSMQASVIDRP